MGQGDFRRGFTLNRNNRWVKKAGIIPWDEIEREYAALAQGGKGQAAKPLRLALGALIIQAQYGFSDKETVAQIGGNPYFQFFCGLRGYKAEQPFDQSRMAHFRRWFTPEILANIWMGMIKVQSKIPR